MYYSKILDLGVGKRVKEEMDVELDTVENTFCVSENERSYWTYDRAFIIRSREIFLTGILIP